MMPRSSRGRQWSPRWNPRQPTRSRMWLGPRGAWHRSTTPGRSPTDADRCTPSPSAFYRCRQDRAAPTRHSGGAPLKTRRQRVRQLRPARCSADRAATSHTVRAQPHDVHDKLADEAVVDLPGLGHENVRHECGELVAFRVLQAQLQTSGPESRRKLPLTVTGHDDHRELTVLEQRQQIVASLASDLSRSSANNIGGGLLCRNAVFVWPPTI